MVLGSSNLKIKNEALLIKWWWRFASEPNPLRKRVIFEKYNWDNKRWDIS
ncbi:hypothetical protein HYC85_010463 [Camellia sinensis]|uniref:Reverse transcriptase zinc-binding domain-containing protein n=1 Tax=Camellia sinensis TaxID=4442 RepID=A0A7J7HIH3_CAMSI|nr:hypothetical protein HYC85_010463 [Camellia sinensis]